MYWFIYFLTITPVITSASSSKNNDLSEPLRKYLLTKITEDITKQLEDSLKQYSKNVSLLLKKANFYPKRDRLDDIVLPRGFGDFKHSDWNNEESASEETTGYDSVGGGWWADEPFLDLTDFSMDVRDEFNQDKPSSWYVQSAFQAPRQDGGQFSDGTVDGLEHDGWGRFLSKRKYNTEKTEA